MINRILIASKLFWSAWDVREPIHLLQRLKHVIPSVLVWFSRYTIKAQPLGWEMNAGHAYRYIVFTEWM